MTREALYLGALGTIDLTDFVRKGSFEQYEGISDTLQDASSLVPSWCVGPQYTTTETFYSWEITAATSEVIYSIEFTVIFDFVGTTHEYPFESHFVGGTILTSNILYYP